MMYVNFDIINVLFCCKTIKKVGKTFAQTNKITYLCNRLRKARAFSSAGLEHLPYKQRVGGSNPSTPTGVFPCGLLFGETAGIFFVYIPLNIIRHSLWLSGNLVGISINLCKSI